MTATDSTVFGIAKDVNFTGWTFGDTVPARPIHVRQGDTVKFTLVNNGTRKGGQPEAMRVLLNSPGLQDLWQVHFSMLGGQEYTSPGMFISNVYDEQLQAVPIAPQILPQGAQAPPPPAHNGPAHWIKVSAQTDGTFTVTNGRNGFSKTYRAVTGTN